MAVVESSKQTLEEFVKQHLKNYQNAVVEIIKNNTNSLFDEDIASLIKEPPLDSMDTIKTKLIALAKKEKIVLKSEEMVEMISSYRASLLELLVEIKDIRNDKLISKVIEFTPKRETETIEIKVSDLESINKDIKKSLKKAIGDCVKCSFTSNMEKLYDENVDHKQKENMNESFSKYMKTTYQKQLLESISIKMMVKDRTLINGTVEQGERYLFTKANSHIFQEEQKSTLK